jgi:DNA polymerase III subunit beta
MDFIVRKADLVKELQLLQGIAERRNAIPILSNVLLDVVDQTMKLSATDLDVSLRCSCEGQASEGGALTASSKKLFEIARSLPEGDVHLKSLPQDYLSIECGRALFKVAGLKREDFPVLPESSGMAGIKISAAVLRDLVSRTAFAATAEDARYFLSGALLLIEKDALCLVATDGHRLSYARQVGVYDVVGPKRILVPKKALSELGRLLEVAEQVEFFEGEGHIVFAVGGRTLTSKLVEGQFPAFESVVALRGDKKILVERDVMLDAVRRVSLLSAERGRSVRVTVKPGWLMLSASSAELGEAQETIAIDYDGEEMSIGFNAQYIIDFLVNAGTEKVYLELKNPDSQGVFVPEGLDSTEHRYVVMPMRL